MGASKSKSTVEKITTVATDVVNKNIQRCVVSATQSQLIKITDVHGDVDLTGVKQKQGVSIDMKCIFSNKMQTDIQNDIAATIAQQAQAKSGDITSAPGGSSSSTATNIKNIFTNNIHNESLSEQVSSSLQQQTVMVSGVDGNVVAAGLSQTQGSEIIAKAMIDTAQYTGALTKVAESIDTASKAESVGIFNSLFGMFGNMYTVLGILFVLIVLVVLYYMFSGSSPAVQVKQVKQIAGGIFRRFRRK